MSNIANLKIKATTQSSKVVEEQSLDYNMPTIKRYEKALNHQNMGESRLHDVYKRSTLTPKEKR